MKRLLSIMLMLTLLAGVTAMGQNKKGRKSKNGKARTEQHVKKSATPDADKNTDNSLIRQLELEDDQEPLTKEEYVDGLQVKHTVWRDAEGNIVREITEEEIPFHRSFEETVVEKSAENHEKPTRDEVFFSVEQMPEFPGSEDAMKQFLKSNINYPPMAAENNIKGTVIVQFIVEKDGSISEVKVLRSVDKDLDREAVRVVKHFPNFIPGRQNGVPVRVMYTLPVVFRLQGNN